MPKRYGKATTARMRGHQTPGELLVEMSEFIRMRNAKAASMWAEKRARQAADIAGLQSGALTPDDVNWFAGGIARNAKIKGDLI